MQKEHTAVFIGHRELFGVDAAAVETEIKKLLASGVTHFLNGGMGRFDWLCAQTVFSLKKTDKRIQNILVIPYLSFHIEEREYFDAILYPEGFERYHFKEAIIKRNEYLVHHAAYAICYVKHSWGGAAQTLRKAKQRGVPIIHLSRK